MGSLLPGPPHRVLVVAADPALAAAVADGLARAGHPTACATDGFTALDLAADFAPHAVVLDPALPGVDGLGLRRRLGRGGGGPPVPVVPLTAEAEGAAGVRELVARVAEALGGAGAAGAAAGAGAVLRVGELTVDPGAGRACRGGRELSLTGHELALLAFLMRHPGRVFSREQLLKRVWGRDFGDLSAVAARVAHLRAELAPDPAAAPLLTEVWGSGYRLDPGGGEVVGAGMTAGEAGEAITAGGAP
ncbi:winged-helix domain-containing protein [Streptomyces sp. NPDC056149]|uniref:winged helix-turn-helix transcriptional regulator n=1 Tax=unclassified Streptomyces TaxID=2593676 RepID=UPI0023818710|nr:response regulator transcription factor [Streptomyces sp. WZ-12]